MSDGESAAIGGTDGPEAVGVELGSTRAVFDVPDGQGGRERRSTLTCVATDEDAF